MEQNTPSVEQTKKAQSGHIKKVLLGILGLIIVYSFISATVKTSSIHQSVDTMNNAVLESQKNTDVIKEKLDEVSQVPTEPEITITSAQLIKAYADNEVSADAQYKGKVLEVTGTVNGISNGVTDDDMIVRLSDGQQYSFTDTSCYANPSEKDRVLSLKKGTTITIVGINDGATLGSPALKNCRIK